MKNNKIKEGNHLFAIISSIILSLFSLIYIGMLLWGVMSSFKGPLEWITNKAGMTKEWHFQNYIDVFKGFVVQSQTTRLYYNYLAMFLNSIIYATGCALFSVFWTALVAYCCAKFNYKICKIIYTVVIVVIVLPIIGALPSEMQIAKTFGLYDNFLGLFIMRSGFQNVNFLIFYATFASLPQAYNEAAAMDGAGQWRIYFTIILPLAKATLSAVFILQFISFWNDYTVPMMYLRSYPVLAYGLYYFQNEIRVNEFANEPMRIVAAVIVAIPILAFFVAFRNKIMGNVTFGGLKG